MMNDRLYLTALAAVLLTASAVTQANVDNSSKDSAGEPTSSVTSTPSPVPATVKGPRASNKWRIQFDESSKSDGAITFRVWPKDAAPIEVVVPVHDHQRENSIARVTRDAFRVALGEAYHVETDDGEDVLVKAGRGTANFGLELVHSTAKDVDIDLDRE